LTYQQFLFSYQWEVYEGGGIVGGIWNRYSFGDSNIEFWHKEDGQ